MGMKIGTAQEAYDDGYADGTRAQRFEWLEANRKEISRLVREALSNPSIVPTEVLERIKAMTEA